MTYSYTYDGNGNILSVSDGTNTTTYVYDSDNQLIRENNQAGGFTHTWEYGGIGNILNRKEYAYTTGALGTPIDTVTYSYDDFSWGDLLTGYDGQTITHDGIGNPLTDGTWTYTWEHGRELASMTSGATTWNYTYDADGMRTQRTNGSTTYSYIYNGSSLSQMTVGNNTLYFAYDAVGMPMAVTYNGTTYYYVTNLQGDVIAILNSSGTPVVNYSYDAWGNPISTTGTMATTLGTLNPLRYRSYVYDQETGLYYLQSRYYNPQWGRFINADSLIVINATLGGNLFAYCYNNPVNLSDHTGQIPFVDDPFAETYQKIGQWLSHYIEPYLKKFYNSLAGSWSASVEVGSGFGAKGKVGPVSVEAAAIIVGDEWSYDADGKSDEIRKASLTVQAELIENINIGVDTTYHVPLEAGEKYGLLCAPGGKADVIIGAYAYNYGIGYKTISSQDIEISFGLSGYFILGGGFEVGINLNEFVRIWNS